jgi:hypothetical protein
MQCPGCCVLPCTAENLCMDLPSTGPSFALDVVGPDHEVTLGCPCVAGSSAPSPGTGAGGGAGGGVAPCSPSPSPPLPRLCSKHFWLDICLDYFYVANPFRLGAYVPASLIIVLLREGITSPKSPPPPHTHTHVDNLAHVPLHPVFPAGTTVVQFVPVPLSLCVSPPLPLPLPLPLPAPVQKWSDDCLQAPGPPSKPCTAAASCPTSPHAMVHCPPVKPVQ